MEALATYESMMYGTEENDEDQRDLKSKREKEREEEYNTNNNNNNVINNSINKSNHDLIRTYGSSSTRALQVRQKNSTVYGRDEPSIRVNFNGGENYSDIREGN